MSPLSCYYLSLLTIILIERPGATLSCDEIREYIWMLQGERGCCPMCPSGQYLVKRCAKFNEPAKCEDCPEGSYAELWNAYKSCPPCKTCLKENGVEHEKTCDSKTNAECKCRAGYSLVQDTSLAEKCIKLCDKGEQLGDSNTCKPCQPGFYSDKQGPEPCKTWTDCAAKGQHLIKNGSRTEDAECSLSTPTTAEGRTAPTSATVTTSVTTAGKPAFAEETKFLIGVIVVAAVVFVIVLIKKKIIYCGGEKRVADFHRCFGIRQDTKPPVQEEFEDVTSVQVKN